jgi:hypothetical protein
MSQDIASEHRDRRVFGNKKPSQTRVGQERVKDAKHTLNILSKRFDLLAPNMANRQFGLMLKGCNEFNPNAVSSINNVGVSILFFCNLSILHVVLERPFLEDVALFAYTQYGAT